MAQGANSVSGCFRKKWALRASVAATALLLNSQLLAAPVDPDSAMGSTLAQSVQVVAAPVDFNIAPQSLASALREFSRMSNRQILYSPQLARDKGSRGVQGRYGPEEALKYLLRGTGLVYTQTNRNAFLIQSNEGAALRPESAQDSAAEDTVGDVETEIIVTAQKREQAISDVPLSIQAISGEDLEDRGVRDLNEVITFVPGASEELSNSIGQRRYQIRGVSQGPGDSTVGYYFDDAAFPTIGSLSFAPPGRSLDMSRVEVLRGPQSTLYGNGAMGGVIRFIPNAPDLSRLEAYAATGYSTTKGGDDSYFIDGALSVPIIQDKLGVRFVGSYEKVGGYIENLFTPEKNIDSGKIQNYRASLLYQPTDRLTAKFAYLKNDVEQRANTLLISADPPISTGTPDDFTHSDFNIFTGTLSYEFDFATLSSTTSYIENAIEIGINFFFPPVGNLNINATIAGETINNETRLVSNGDSPFQWVIGTFYFDTEIASTNLTLPSGVFPDSDGLATSNSISFFGEASHELLDGKLIPLVGLRYFTDRRSNGTEVGGVPLGDAQKATFNSLNPRFNLSYMPGEDSLYFVNVAKGFRSGGFNNPVFCALNPVCENAVGSDTIWSYELGTKQSLAGRQVGLDGTVYYQDWQDIRQGQRFGAANQDIQVGDARLYGVDLGLMLQPSALPGFSVQTSANWNSAKFVRIEPILTQQLGVQDGRRLPFVPEWTFSTAANYERELAAGFTAQMNITYSHIEGQLGDFTSLATGGNRDLLSTRLGVKTDRFGIFLVGRNLLNENGTIFTRQVFPNAPTLATQDRPRVLGFELTMEY